MTFRLALATLAFSAMLAGTPILALADEPPKEAAGTVDHSAMGHDMAAMDANAMPSSKAFAEVNAKMHQNMAIEFSGNADVDFVRGMIPHHQGAIDMAKVALEHGKDPAIRALAEEIIKAQEAEIAMMKDWLAKNAK